MNKLLVLYRCCENECGELPKRNSRPHFFDKLKSFDTLVKSLKEAESSLDLSVELQVIHDGPTGTLYDHVNKYASYINGIDKINCRSNEGSYKECLKTANSESWDYLYMVEDDYLHLPNAIRVLLEGAHKYRCVTGYFHMDRLTRTDDLTRGRESLGFTRSSHWVTNESTTCTYMVKSALKDIILGAANRYLLQDRTMWRALLEESIRLWVPTPGVSTHLERNLMTPFVDWEFEV